MLYEIYIEDNDIHASILIERTNPFFKGVNHIHDIMKIVISNQLKVLPFHANLIWLNQK